MPSLRSATLALALLGLAACDAAKFRTESVPTPDWTTCNAHPEVARCAEYVATYCQDHPEDGTWCADAALEDAGVDASGDAEPDADATPDAGPVCDCSAAEPVCIESTGTCVACTDSDLGACKGTTPVCDAASNTCVACLTPEQCTDDKPVCADNTCTVCTADADCAARGKVCDTASGACVACVPNKDNPAAERCDNGRACDPQKHTCTGEPRNSVGFCGRSNDTTKAEPIRCVSDNECIAGHRCVVTEFPQGTAYGAYCLQQIGDALCPNRVAAKRTARSTLGVEDSFCFPDDSFTTCEGVLDFQSVCTTPDDCGAAGINDALCISQRCTYGCDSSADCSGTNSCIGASSSQYCAPN